MKFHPIKYRQPIFGDSRCALYSLANILDDNGILLFCDVGQMTTVNQEHAFLSAYSKVMPRSVQCRFGDKIFGILPYFIVPSNDRITVEQVRHIQPVLVDNFGLSLIDCLSPDGVNAHTVVGFWFDEDELVVLDPQKNEPIETTKTEFFQKMHVVGIRFIEGKDSAVHEFSISEFPHIFATDEPRPFCKPQGSPLIHRAFKDDGAQSGTFSADFPSIRHEVTFPENK